jgi:hypothetical protein
MRIPADPRRPAWKRAVLVTALALVVGACVAESTPSSAPSAPPTTAPITPSPSAVTPSPLPSGSPAPTPEPPLSLALPRRQDKRVVSVRFDAAVPREGDGEITVTVANRTDRRIHELVVRWPTELRDTLFLAPFKPSEERIREFGPPLHQDWTKWVDGPGESGEPAGTTSLGWGPLLPNDTLRIRIFVTRRVAGDAAFDLQVLAGERLLTLPDGSPAELRVGVP